MTGSKKELVKVWIAAGLWLGIIIVESSKIGGSNNTSRILYPIFHLLFGMNPVQFEPWHTVIRKAGHFVGYFTMSVLFFRAWRATLPQQAVGGWSATWAGIAWAMTTLVASFDEWHQAYIPGRGSSVHDVLLDSTAALAAQILLWWISRDRTKPGVQLASGI